jgi:hypothetical protein
LSNKPVAQLAIHNSDVRRTEAPASLRATDPTAHSIAARIDDAPLQLALPGGRWVHF